MSKFVKVIHRKLIIRTQLIIMKSCICQGKENYLTQSRKIDNLAKMWRNRHSPIHYVYKLVKALDEGLLRTSIRISNARIN